MPQQSPLAATLWRDRLIIITGLVVVSALAWLYMIDMHLDMSDMDDMMSGAGSHAWGASDFVFALAMWSAMMIGMMLPGASPMILTFATITRQRLPGQHLQSTGMFLLGYVVLWVAYSAGAAIAQWIFQSSSLISHHGVSQSPYLAAALLVVAGAYQLTPFKYACLHKCRTPMGFILHEWRPGPKGALIMGIRHGSNCVACCWAWMALMFVLGIMNIWWMLALTIFGLVEKIAPAPVWTGRASGVAMVAWAGVILFGG